MQFSPPSKGKIERRHDYWQKRLPPRLAADQILELCGANTLLEQLLTHANEHEIHRELGTTPRPPSTKRWPKNDRSCSRLRLVLVGPTSGASKRAFASVTTAKSRSTFTGWPLPTRPVRLSCAVCAQTEMCSACVTGSAGYPPRLGQERNRLVPWIWSAWSTTATGRGNGAAKMNKSVAEFLVPRV